MNRCLRLLGVLGILGLLAMLISPISVLAIADPDTPPQVSAVYVYEDLLEEGDTGVLIDYYLDYSSTPNETATEAYMAVFIDTDGATQLQTVAPYTFVGSGYGRGLIWMYFSEAETTTDNLSSTNQALYEIWLMGNPALDWDGDPPKTIAGIDYWQTTGDASVLLALRVLYYADVLELIWALDMVEVTSLGSRLTSVGASYFENVITNLRTMAPAAFSAGQYDPVMEDLDYTTSFGAILTNGTGTAAGSPIALSPEYSAGTARFINGNAEVTGYATEWNATMEGAAIEYTADGVAYTVLTVAGSDNLTLTIPYANAGGTGAYTMTNNVDVTGLGTFTIVLNRGTSGNATSDVCTVTGGTVYLVAGTNTINTETAIGNIVVAVEQVDTQAQITDTITGTALDLTEVAARFGMSRLLFSGFVWLAITIVICAGTYRLGEQGGMRGGGKVVMLIFDLCIIGGAVLGLLSMVVAVLMFIGFGALTGYVIFFRGAHF